MAPTNNATAGPNAGDPLPDGFDTAWLAQLCGVLGLDADTDDPELILQAARDAAGDSDAAPSSVAASAKRLGMELLDADTAAALRAEAAEGRKQVVAAALRERETAVTEAIRTGRIAPSRRDHWLKLLAADPGMKEVLASTPPGTAVPIEEIGHSQTADSEIVGPGPRWFR